MSQLAIYGGPQSITDDFGDIFDWPIITDEDESAVLDVLRKKNMSGIDVTIEFERESFLYFQGRSLFKPIPRLLQHATIKFMIIIIIYIH